MQETTRRERGSDQGGPTWLALVAVLAGLVGVVAIVVAVFDLHPGPPGIDGPVGSLNAAGETPDPLPASTPVRLRIPALGVDSEVISLGLAPDGTLAVPQPGPDLDKAAWFENSPAPGQLGPSIIEGHVATAENGPSIFHDLGALEPGDTIRVRREDASIAVFTVEALRDFPKDEFPTELIYGGDLSSPTLRLITCSNFDDAVGNHTGNLIVFARLSRVIGR